MSVADASEAEFTACRNSECYSGLGKTKQDDNFSWAYTEEYAGIELKLDDSGATPAAHQVWYFYDYSGSIETPGDHYSLTIQSVGAAAATTLFDAQVDYITAPSDPTLVSEGYSLLLRRFHGKCRRTREKIMLAEPSSRLTSRIASRPGHHRELGDRVPATHFATRAFPGVARRRRL